MPDIIVSCENKINFPGQNGIPVLAGDYIPTSNTIESIYGNVGVVSFDLVFSPFDATIALSGVEIVSVPNFYNINRLSFNRFRVSQNDVKIFSDRYDFALFNSDGSVNSIIEEKSIIPNMKKSLVNYLPPAETLVSGIFVVKYTYTKVGMPQPPDNNRNIILTQNVYWDYNVSLNKLSEFITEGDY